LMGIFEYLLSKVGDPWKLVFACLNPFDWIFLCIGLCLKTVAMTYTKFGLIAATVGGRPFCEAAPKAFSVLQTHLGEAVVVDYVGKRVMGWCTYVIAVGIGLAAWKWADDTQGYIGFSASYFGVVGLFFFVVLYAWIISYPFLGIAVVILTEGALSDHNDNPQARMVLNSVFVSVFVGCVSHFLLDFLTSIVVTAMDVSLFCYAVEQSCGTAQPERFDELYGSIKGSLVVGTPLLCDAVVQGFVQVQLDKDDKQGDTSDESSSSTSL